MLSDFDVDKFLLDKPLALTQAGLEELRLRVLARLTLFDAGAKPMLEALSAEISSRQPATKASAATGVIPIRGTISQHADACTELMGGAATESIAAQLRAYLADESISKVVLDIDSPGGTTYGVAELAQEIFESRGRKPIVAVANSLAASAAYWIGASADYFYATPGGLVGSIGVFAMHQDVSKMAEDLGVKTTYIAAGKYKVAGNPFEPLDDDTYKRVEARVNETYEQFVRDVARGRGVTAAAVRGGYGEGDVLTAKQAKAEGMVDGVMTLDAVLAKAFRTKGTSGGSQANSSDVSSETAEPSPPGPLSHEGRGGDEEPDEAALARLARMKSKEFRARAAGAA